MGQTQRSPEGPRHLHRIPRLSEAPWDGPSRRELERSHLYVLSGIPHTDGPQTTKAAKGNIGNQMEEMTCLVEGRTIGPRRVLPRSPQKPVSGNWSL